MSATRLYIVSQKQPDGSTKPVALVDATSKQQARHFIADQHFDAEVASGKEVAELMRQGIEVKTAGAAQ